VRRELRDENPRTTIDMSSNVGSTPISIPRHRHAGSNPIFPRCAKRGHRVTRVDHDIVYDAPILWQCQGSEIEPRFSQPVKPTRRKHREIVLVYSLSVFIQGFQPMEAGRSSRTRRLFTGEMSSMDASSSATGL